MKSVKQKASKPVLEKVSPNFGASFSYKTFNYHNQNQHKNFWHYHPEIELVYVNKGAGRRLVGSHTSHYRNGNLILVGSHLPHCGFTDSLKESQNETVIHLLPETLGARFFDIPEMESIKKLMEKAKYGMVFHGDDKRRIGAKIIGLSQKKGMFKLLGLLEIFQDLALSESFRLLNAEGFMLEAKVEDNERINHIFNFVKQAYHRPISLDEVAEMAHMTKPSFSRYFKKITGKTFVTFVNDYRLTHAAKLLHENQQSILDICHLCGFNNFSHFNKKFKAFTGNSPSEYRKELSMKLGE